MKNQGSTTTSKHINPESDAHLTTFPHTKSNPVSLIKKYGIIWKKIKDTYQVSVKLD